uniref:Outer membrane receptor proteins, mostly Fe transport n=1 Tax=Candidatus Kentrum sp. FW TaxID=2126338 RepID=A0A450TWM9_9GAMM|nr:MAG: Outer membrane receptor proteins, mostly Fe transport [Candidatus Kentron sp. FW]
MRRENTLLRNGLRMALLGPVLALGAPGMAIAENVSPNTQQDENIPAGEPGDPIELDPIVAVGRMPASTVVFGREADTPFNRRLPDVLKGMPNILDNSETALLPSVRGIDGSGEMSFNSSYLTGAQPRVNTLVDGVARPFKGSSLSSLGGVWDVEAVEVARGPQTTTTGRSSLNGAVQVSTRDPVHEWEAAARAGWFTEHKNVEGAAMMNVPLIADQVALRFAFEGSDGESYVDTSGHPFGDEIDELKYEHYRGKLLLTPDALPGTELVFSIEETKARQAQEPYADDTHADDLVFTNAWDKFIYDNEQTVYSAKLLQGLGEKMDLEVRVSYLDNTWEWPGGQDSFGAFDFDYTTETTSTEVLLHFEELGFIDKGMIGVAYEYQDDDARNKEPGSYFAAYGEKENFAIFGEIEAGIGGGWTAIAGGRFEWDDRDRETEQLNAFFGDFQAKAEMDDEAFSPKLGIRYDGADKYVAGYTYSEGWRPGGVDFSNAQFKRTSTYDDERLKNHEIWVRGNPLGRLSINASAFYYEFEDMQQRGATSYGPCFGVAGAFNQWMSPCMTGNIPEAEGYGVELDAQWDITDAWRISGGLGLLETEITDAGSVVPHYDGQELSQSPNLTANMGISWVSPRGFDAEISARYVDSFTETYHFHDIPSADTDSYTLYDFKAGYETKFRGTELRIDAWVENLTDKRYTSAAMASSKKEVPGRPRTIGVALTARF